ncbi:hypothetical protein H9Q09_01130 [Aurantimonas sp. DM33-3]|uniref:hypothetical protein n=1 Tax=Aurantimonas sp. DM33-3 TaxID=2766955 RepID=UPI0016522F27|nr:hypothetical protein [Aurantimonas sp. DM33-3]MBC6714788.1 hypothetical protein [Aurantimonas sp. DM33-3]
MNHFDRLERMASQTIDWLNGESFTLIPIQQAINGRAGRDQDRPIIEGKGVFEYTSIESGLQLGVRKSYREANDLRALQVGRQPILSVDRRVFDDVNGDPIEDALVRQGDFVRFPEDQNLPDFDVVSAQPDGHSRIVIKLVSRGRSFKEE